MNFWSVILIMFSTVASMILMITGFNAIYKLKNIFVGISIFLIGIVISFEGAVRIESLHSPTIWGFETFLLSFLFIWIIILLGGKKDE